MTAPTAPSDAQVAAYTAGRDAFASGSAATTCPYPAGEDPDGLRQLWVRGFVQARQDAGFPPPGLRRQFTLGKKGTA